LKQNKTAEIGQRKRISESDILKINRMYDCGMEPTPTTPEPPVEKPRPKEVILKAVGTFLKSVIDAALGSKQ
jgi:hypothetical protein